MWIQDDADDDWFPEDIFEAFQELRNRKVFDVEDMYTIADAWGWTWERELKNKPPRRWSQEWEVELAIQVMEKACSYFMLIYSTVMSCIFFYSFSWYSFCFNLHLYLFCNPKSLLGIFDHPHFMSA